MGRKRRIVSAVMTALAALMVCSACGSAAPATVVPEKKPLNIVASIFPVYDWTREILGEQAAETELTLLLDSGVDLHSYQPTAEDMLRIADCDVLLYVGGESDGKITSAWNAAPNPDRQVVSLLEVLGDRAKTEEWTEGMEEEEDAPGLDEHVWLSLNNAQLLCAAIADALAQADPEHAAEYAENCASYCGKLAALDAAYRDAVSTAANRTLVFGDRFPFRYLVDDYGLEYYAAFAGCSAETEASFETVLFLAQKLDETGANALLTLERSDQRLARTIRENTQTRGQLLLELDSMQSATTADAAAGATYLSIMEHNLAVLRQALQ